MAWFTYRPGLSAEVTADYQVRGGVVIVAYNGASKVAPIGKDARSTIEIRNNLLRAILIEQALNLPDGADRSNIG
jgi:hypothetical protein